jgi:hypothetical protein
MNLDVANEREILRSSEKLIMLDFHTPLLELLDL